MPNCVQYATWILTISEDIDWIEFSLTIASGWCDCRDLYAQYIMESLKQQADAVCSHNLLNHLLSEWEEIEQEAFSDVGICYM